VPKNSLHVLATDREVRNAKPRGKRAEYRIKGAPGLVLRVTSNGTKTWVFRYVSPSSGRQTKLSLGSYPALGLSAAKDRAQRLAIEVRDGHDPAAQRRADKAAGTFAELAADYMRDRKLRNDRSGRGSDWTKEVQRLLDRDILPVIGQHKAKAITRRQVADVVEIVAERGSFAIADKVLGVVRAIYRWAVETGHLDIDPTFGLKKRHAGQPRKRVLSDQELRTLWRSIESSDMTLMTKDILRLEVLLGLRVKEIAGAAKNEIDLVNQVWILPGGRRTKSGREHRVPLPPVASSILEGAIKRAGDSYWVFPSDTGSGSIKQKSVMRALLRLRKRLARPHICASFEAWSVAHGHTAHPASPTAIAAWLRFVVESDPEKSVSRSALKEHLAAVVADQRSAGNRIDLKHPAIAAACQSAPDIRPDVGANRLGYGTHDLRRTLATGLGERSVQAEVLDRILDHAATTVTNRHYNHADHFEARRKALELWERHVMSVVEVGEPLANRIPGCLEGV
jgi:integrase